MSEHIVFHFVENNALVASEFKEVNIHCSPSPLLCVIYSGEWIQLHGDAILAE